MCERATRFTMQSKERYISYNKDKNNNPKDNDIKCVDGGDVGGDVSIPNSTSASSTDNGYPAVTTTYLNNKCDKDHNNSNNHHFYSKLHYHNKSYTNHNFSIISPSLRKKKFGVRLLLSAFCIILQLVTVSLFAFLLYSCYLLHNDNDVFCTLCSYDFTSGSSKVIENQKVIPSTKNKMIYNFTINSGLMHFLSSVFCIRNIEVISAGGDNNTTYYDKVYQVLYRMQNCNKCVGDIPYIRNQAHNEHNDNTSDNTNSNSTSSNGTTKKNIWINAFAISALDIKNLLDLDDEQNIKVSHITFDLLSHTLKILIHERKPIMVMRYNNGKFANKFVLLDEDGYEIGEENVSYNSKYETNLPLVIVVGHYTPDIHRINKIIGSKFAEIVRQNKEKTHKKCNNGNNDSANNSNNSDDNNDNTLAVGTPSAECSSNFSAKGANIMIKYPVMQHTRLSQIHHLLLNTRIYKNISSIVLINMRRVNLYINNGTMIKLPANGNITQILTILNDQHIYSAILLGKFSMLDFRFFPQKLYIAKGVERNLPHQSNLKTNIGQ